MCAVQPDKGDVLERIEVRGGDVINWNGQRVHATSGSIGMTKWKGDLVLHIVAIFYSSQTLISISY